MQAHQCNAALTIISCFYQKFQVIIQHAGLSITGIIMLTHLIYCDSEGHKNENFQIKNLIFFLVFAQNIGCGNLLEPRTHYENMSVQYAAIFKSGKNDNF